MSETIDYTDEYGDRYVTSIKDTLVGKEIITQIYSPRPFLEKIRTKRKKNSIEIFGTISTFLEIYDNNNKLITKKHEFDEDWIEVWNECANIKNKSRFKYNLNNIITSDNISECKSGSYLTDVSDDISDDNGDNVVWGYITADGENIFKGDVNSTLFKFIDVWGNDGNVDDIHNIFFPYTFSFYLV